MENKTSGRIFKLCFLSLTVVKSHLGCVRSLQKMLNTLVDERKALLSYSFQLVKSSIGGGIFKW